MVIVNRRRSKFPNCSVLPLGQAIKQTKRSRQEITAFAGLLEAASNSVMAGALTAANRATFFNVSRREFVSAVSGVFGSDIGIPLR